MNLNAYDIRTPNAIAAWDEGIPLGNGKIGVLLYGTDRIRMSLDRVDLWDTRSAPAALESGFCYENLKRLAQSGSEEDWNELLRLFDNVYNDTAYPSKITAGGLEIAFEALCDPSFALSLDTAEAVITDRMGETRITGFASATEFIGVFRIYGAYSVSVNIPRYISETDDAVQARPSICNPRAMGYPQADIVRDGAFLYTRQKTHTEFEYGIVVLEKDCGAYRELYVTITASTDGADDLAAAKTALKCAADRGYDALFTEHAAWWRDYWGKSEISVGDPTIERVYYRSQYLFASCSRKGFYPMPLQGVWTADNDMLPPWKGDYHHDTNTQLSYQAYLKANRLPEGEVFLDYLWDLRDAFRTFAHDFYGVDGLLIPGVSTIDGKPMGGWPQYSLSPTMSVWTAQSFDEYYLYTDDTEFLRTRAYPFFSEIGRAIEGLLEERNGKRYLPLSSSPEIHDNRRDAYLKPNSNFDLALMRYLYETLAGYAETLGDAPAAIHWREILSELDDTALDSDCVLLADGEALRESHRHFSHLMCLYPLHLINYDTDAHKAVYRRTLYELEKYGTGMWIGFSYAMAAQIYAMAQNGNGAYQNLCTFAHGFVGDNGFHLNGDFKHYGYSTFHYRPFTLESSFGFCDALHEMLLQDHMGYIHVFPAIPADWRAREISFTDLRSRGGVLVSAVRDANGVRQICLRCERTHTVRVQKPAEWAAVVTVIDGGRTCASVTDDRITLMLPADKTVILEKV